MRLWSLHPSYLDSKGLIALWREGLLAQKVLQGQTRGYRNHPQLIRFKDLNNPVAAMATFLEEVFEEAVRREYNFDAQKIAGGRIRKQIPVTSGQLDYEMEHLCQKLWKRDRQRYWQLKNIVRPKTHPIFLIRRGAVETWEAV